MNIQRTLIATLAISLISGSALALNPMEAAPAEADVVARLNVKEALASPLKDKIMDRVGRQRLEAGRQVLQNLTGMNLEEDLSEIWLFGRIDRDKEGVVMARGRFEQEKLVALVSLNDNYEQREMFGAKVHTWNDDGQKYAVFIDDFLLLSENGEALRMVLETNNGGRRSLMETETGKLLAAQENPAIFWGALINSNTTLGEFADFARAIDLSHVMLSIDPGGDQVNATLAAIAEDSDALPEYRAIAEGGMALSRLLREEEDLATLIADNVTISTSEEALLIQTSVAHDLLLNVLDTLD